MTTDLSNPFRLDGETALITGGGSGIGLGIARCMVRVGARVVLVGRRELELTSACRELGVTRQAIHMRLAPAIKKVRARMERIELPHLDQL